MRTKSKPKLNVRLLRRIQKHILKEPRRFFMDWYYEHQDNAAEWREKAEEVYEDLSKTPPKCKTAACIAGWACVLTRKQKQAEKSCDWAGIAQRELGLDIFSRSALFLDNEWPDPFSHQYRKAKTPKQRAQIACARIDYLIKTGE
jgi:hypothetical protein